MRTPRALVVTTLALAASLLSPVAAHAEGSATISGVVSDRTQAPVAGTVVSAYSVASRTTRETTVDAHGTYTVAADPGKVFVCFEPPAAADVDFECWDDQRFSLDAQAVTVADGEARTEVDAELDPSSHLRGTLTDERGRPAAGVAIGTSWRHDSTIHYSLEPEGYTDAQGRYDVRLDTWGSHKICFSDSLRARYLSRCWQDGAWFDVARGESRGDLDAQLPDATLVSGRVTTRDGGLPTGVRVSLGEDPRFRTTVGRDGRWSILGPSHGTYQAVISTPPGRYVSQTRQVVVTQDGVDVPGVDTVLQVGRPLTSRDRPRLVGRIVAGNVITLRRPRWDGPVSRTTVQWYVGRRAVRTDARPEQLYLRPWMIGRKVAVVVRATTTTAERTPGVSVSNQRVVRKDPGYFS